jgi:dTDP-4-dehydrorhamnose reductase
LKLLITGSSGLYGSKLAELSVAKGFEVFPSDIQNLSRPGNFIKLDVSEKEQVVEVFNVLKPDAVVHAASLTDVDKCELNKELAWEVNVEGTKNIAHAAQKVGAFLAYISTDYVFSGEKGYYVESDSPDPINYYGLTKLEAETLVQDLPESDFVILRPSVIYGSTPAAGKVNFALWLIETLQKGEKVRIINDQWNTPTLNTNLSEMTIEILERRLTGIYHSCGATRVSRYEFAMKIAEAFNLNSSLIQKVTSSEFHWIARRPIDSSLDTTLANRMLHVKPLNLADALQQLKVALS